MAPPAWFWLLVAWLVARDFRPNKWANWARQTSQRVAHRGASAKPGMWPRPSLRAVLGLAAAAAGLLALVLMLVDESAADQNVLAPVKPMVELGPGAVRIQSDAMPQGPAAVEEDGAPAPKAGPRPGATVDDFDAQIGNSTLGFEKIYVVNLPERTDKRDALSLIGALTNIKLQFVNAIKGSQVPDKALPLGVDREGWHDGGIGSWRSQMNVIRSMVEDNVASALILEDDADWDVRIKEQLQYAAQGTRVLQNLANREPAYASARPRLPPLASPYGDDWDILWLGHCGETFPERIPGHHVVDAASARYKYYAMQGDATLVGAAHAEAWIRGDLARHPGTRWVHFSGGPTCSAAYALSQQGARKVLLALSVGGSLVAQLDNAMADLCRDHAPWDAPGDDSGPPGYPGARMRCLSVTPAPFSQHRPRGRRAAESDIETVEDGDGVRDVGESPNLIYSARLNAQNLILGRPLEDQFEGREGVPVALEELQGGF